jgi:formylglycine-generating enzyme required for sulfatase activity
VKQDPRIGTRDVVASATAGQPSSTEGLAPASAMGRVPSATNGPAAGKAVPGTHDSWGVRTGRGTSRKIKILFVAANTGAGDQLALDEEYRAIEQSLRGASYRDAFQLIACLATRRDDLQAALLEHRPEVVHFACHGSSQAEVLLASDGPGSEPMSAEALASLFRVLRDNVVLVVFNACFGSAQAAAIRPHVGLTIGMRERIEDGASIKFASALYRALGYGRSVREAFELGVAEIEAVDARQKHVPQLFAGTEMTDPRLLGRAADGAEVRLVDRVVDLSDPWRGVQAREGFVPRLAAKSRWGRAAVLAVLLVAVLLVTWLVWRSRRAPEAPPEAGMVRFAAATVRPGVFDASQRPVVCASLERSEDCAERAQPEQVAPVALSTFDLDATEVTNADYARWLTSRPEMWTVTSKGIVRTRQEPGVPLALVSEACGEGLALAGGRVIASPDKAAWPVVCVTWHGASEYCRAQHKRLPLEAEWELAAKGGEGRAFPWGSELPRQDGVAFDLRDGATAHPQDVGTAAQDVSPEGVRDLGGNAAEWVEDGRGAIDQGTIRGGSWASRGPCHVLGSGCKQIARDTWGPDVGFRCARSVLDDERR